MPQLVKCLLCKHKELSKDPQRLNSLARQPSQSLSSGFGECSCLKRYNGEQQKASALTSGLHMHTQACVLARTHVHTQEHSSQMHRVHMHTQTQKQERS